MYSWIPPNNDVFSIDLIGHESWHSLQAAQIGITQLMVDAYLLHSAWRWIVGEDAYRETIFEISAYAMGATIAEFRTLFAGFKAGRITKLSGAQKKQIRDRYYANFLAEYARRFPGPL